MVTHQADEEGRWLAVVLKVDSLYLILKNIYGYNDNRQNWKCLEKVRELLTSWLHTLLEETGT